MQLRDEVWLVRLLGGRIREVLFFGLRRTSSQGTFFLFVSFGGDGETRLLVSYLCPLLILSLRIARAAISFGDV